MNNGEKASSDCPKCGSAAISQTLNRIGIPGTHAPRTDTRYIHWVCGHPLAPNTGCGYAWENQLKNKLENKP